MITNYHCLIYTEISQIEQRFAVIFLFFTFEQFLRLFSIGVQIPQQPNWD
jgi:hypothetical protein